MKYLKKKKPFILLELLLAISLISICAIPLLHTPFSRNLKALDTLKNFELQRLSEITWSEILLDLDQFDWDAMVKSKKKAPSISLEPIQLHLSSLGPCEYQRKYKIWARRTKKGDKNSASRLLYCKITFFKTPKEKNKKKFFNHILIKRAPKTQPTENPI